MLGNLTFQYLETARALRAILGNGRTQSSLASESGVNRALISLLVSEKEEASATPGTIGKICSVVDRDESIALLTAYLTDVNREVSCHFGTDAKAARAKVTINAFLAWRDT